MTTIRKCMDSLSERYAQSRFQQRIDAWQNAHPAAAERLCKVLNGLVRAVCLSLIALAAGFLVMLGALIFSGQALCALEAFGAALALFGLWLSMHTLRRL